MKIKPNYAQHIFEQSKSYANKLAVVDDRHSLTYSDLETHVKYFAHKLKKSGIKPQQRVILYFDDCVEWYVAFLASIATGINPVCVNHGFPLETLNKIIDQVDAYAVVSEKKLDLPISQFTKAQILSTNGDQILDYYQWHPDEHCFWFMSSGTTGNSKAMVHRHANLQIHADLVAQKNFDLQFDDRVLNTGKLSFSFGFITGIIYGLSVGVTNYLISGAPAPTRVFDLIDKYQITYFFCVPTVINSILKHNKDRELSKSVRMMGSAGETLSAILSTRFQERFGIIIHNSLGSSEALIQTRQTLENYEPGTCGTPMEGFEYQLRNDDGGITPDGEIGELYIKAPTLATEYWKDWEYTKKTFVGEWLKTGDKLKRLPSGNYYYVARANDLVKVNGLFTAPLEIEAAIMEMPTVTDCAITIKTSKEDLKEIHAFILIDSTATALEIQNFLKNKLAPHAIPKHYHFIDEIPKTITGKKMRYRLRTMVTNE